ncbi:Methyladenine glycosylase family protein [uncultured delta proteobacterium]|uniref:Methyladenine glycosylase family protein n=1 Tax=uncultured delta proteobacterium TaxID=34034 RepID=A0A212JJU2_9DELT|nr:Methyladenine glycosylase family protein [uncultured delta proteobacterium]
MPDKPRCAWAVKSDIERDYHDAEWGVPRFDDAGQFEFLVLESAQAGLSWVTILKKREGYRKAFAGFDPLKVSTFTEKDVDRLMLDAGIVRNRKKIESTVSNARLFLELAAKHGSFSNYIWSFVDGKPVVNAWKDITQVPATSPISDAMAKEFKRLGFKFLGSTVLYAHMQATGMVNDHLVSCFRHKECGCKK